MVGVRVPAVGILNRGVWRQVLPAWHATENRMHQHTEREQLHLCMW